MPSTPLRNPGSSEDPIDLIQLSDLYNTLRLQLAHGKTPQLHDVSHATLVALLVLSTWKRKHVRSRVLQHGRHRFVPPQRSAGLLERLIRRELDTRQMHHAHAPSLPPRYRTAVRSAYLSSALIPQSFDHGQLVARLLKQLPWLLT